MDIQALGDSSVTLRAFGWVDQRHYEFLKVRSEAIRLVKEAFDVAGIVMPAPVYSVRMQEPATLRPQGAAHAQTPIDIRRRGDIQREVDEDRRVSTQPDLLRADAPPE